MSTAQSWAFLVGGAVLLLAPSVALLAGWRPSFLAGSRAPVPLLGAAGLCGYGTVVVTAIPQVLGASTGVRTTCAYAGLGLMGTAVGLVLVYDFLAGAYRRGRK